MVSLPSLTDLASVVAFARFNTPLDGEDNEGGGYKDPVTNYFKTTGVDGILAAGEGYIDGNYDPAEARRRLFVSLLEAIEVGLERPTSKTAPGAEHPAQIIEYALAYMLSPALGSLRNRVARLYDATASLIDHPTCAQYAAGKWFGQTWLQAGAGRSEATGDYHPKRASEALKGGTTVTCIAWQTAKQKELKKLLGDWRDLFGSPSLTIDTAGQDELVNLAVSLGVFYLVTAAEKTVNWPAGAPSKVDTWGNIKKVFGGVISAGVAAFSGNYVGVLNTALHTAGNDPIPKKVQGAISAGISELQTWAG